MAAFMEAVLICLSSFLSPVGVKETDWICICLTEPSAATVKHEATSDFTEFPATTSGSFSITG